MDIQISMDSVCIERQTVTRPNYITRSVWMSYWEKIKALRLR